jgi:hypothetical protein
MNRVHEEFELKEPARASANEVRDAFPASAAIVDDFKSVFGDWVKALLIEEGGKTVQAKQYQPDSAFGGSLSPSQFIRLGEISRENAQMLEKREADRGKK